MSLNMYISFLTHMSETVYASLYARSEGYREPVFDL